jgi:hypothetical protein
MAPVPAAIGCWSSGSIRRYTRLAKEIASAAIYGSSIDKAETRDREHFTRELAGRPAELAGALDALADTMGRLRGAHEPDDLLPR